MRTIKVRDIASPVAVSINNPSECGYDKFIGLEHYDSGEFVITRYSGVELLTSAVKEFRENDILIARRNVYLKRAGIVRFSGITSGDSIILRVHNDINETLGYTRDLIVEYLPLVLNTEEFWLYANKHADGMNSKRISKDTLLDYEFVLPDEDEIRSISNKAWAAYRLKETYKRLLVATDEMVKSQFIEMFGRIESREAWESVLAITNGKKYPDEYRESGPYKICGSGGTMGYGDQFMCPADTIILGRKGNINSPIYMDEPYWIVDTAFCLKPSEKLNPVYLYYWCKQYDFTRLNKQAVLPSLTKNDLYSIEIEVPPLELQQEFATIVRQADKSKFELKKAIEAIDQVIKSLINS